MNATSSSASAPGGRSAGRSKLPITLRWSLTRVVVDAPEALRQQGGEQQPDGHRLPVAQVPLVVVRQRGALQRVGERVAVVEDHAAPALALVLGHDRRLDADAARHLLLDGLVGLGGLAQEGVLGDLAAAAGPLARREGREGLGVAQHGVGLPERADEVLALGQVDPGLAADGGVDLGQQRGGDVHVGRPPVVGRRGEAGDVGHDAAADGDDGVGPREAGPGEPAGQVLHRGERLGVLPVGDDAELGRDAGVEVVHPARRPDRLLRDDHGRLGAGRQEASRPRGARPGPTRTG